MGARIIDLTGQRIHWLTVLSLEGRMKNGAARWKCRCERCNTLCFYAGADLRRGQVKSCGCWDREACRVRATTHGGHGTREYNAWCDMWRRCTGPTRKDFHHYGGRGIRICAQWKSFDRFRRDMGSAPPHTVLDRIDPNGNYEPDNCRWQPAAEMNDNKRSSRLITYRGVTQALAVWCRELGVPYWRTVSRLKRGLSFDQAINPNPMKGHGFRN